MKKLFLLLMSFALVLGVCAQENTEPKKSKKRKSAKKKSKNASTKS
ncbi:MAG: hypothetical protein IPQ27_01945 [Chitinophagaceae bacterium]|nr:hypothetical protein [Chitinophagaceae bacterium]